MDKPSLACAWAVASILPPASAFASASASVSMKVSDLKILIRYHFRSNEGSKAGLLKADGVAIATALYDASMIDVNVDNVSAV